jgi:hypothetical protein
VKILLEIDSLPDPSTNPEDAYWPFRFVLGQVKGLTTLRVEQTSQGRPSPGFEAYVSDADASTLHRYLGDLVLPRAQRYHVAFHSTYAYDGEQTDHNAYEQFIANVGDDPDRVANVCLHYGEGENPVLEELTVADQVDPNDPEELEAYASAFQAAADWVRARQLAPCEVAK